MRINHYTSVAEDSTQIASVSSSFSAARKNTIALDVFPSGSNFKGWLHGLVVNVSSIASSPTKLTFRIGTNPDGDSDMVVTDFEGELFTGITTATEGAVSYRINLLTGFTGSTLYIFWKTDTGTCTVDNVKLSWYT